jgi:hypothetical protein
MTIKDIETVDAGSSVLADTDMVALIEELFDIWLEQKVIRSVFTEKFGEHAVQVHDQESIGLNLNDQYGSAHSLLTEELAIDLIGKTQERLGEFALEDEKKRK